MITAVQEQNVYIIRFRYDPEIISLVKNVPGRLYVPAKKYWTIPLDKLGFLINQFRGTRFDGMLQVYSNEAIDENATLDATDHIPEIDLSDIPLYVKEGEHLFQHQLDFMKYAIDRQRRGLTSGFILADQMGLGKTAEAMNLALYNKQFNDVKHCLIIACVNSAKYNWVDDIKKHTNGEYVPYLIGSRKKRDGSIRLDGSGAEKLQDLMLGRMYGKKDGDPLPYFLVLNIEAFHMRSGKHYVIRERLTALINAGYIGMVILDECHKNIHPSSSKQGRQLMQLKKDTRNVRVEWLPMTGTPIVNKPTDLYGPLKLVDGHGYTNFEDWRNHFCIYGEYGKRDVIAYKNIPELKQMLQKNMLRRLKSQVLNLPPKIHTIEYVENTPYQAKLYEDLVKSTIEHKAEILASTDPRAKFIRLRQVNGSPEIVDNSLVVDKKYLAKNAKLVRLLELVDTIVSNGEKVVIFSNWVEPLRTIYKFLSLTYDKICCYTGTMKPEDCERNKKIFIENPEYKIMIGTVGKLGVSHTFTVANNVIFYDLPWNPSTMEQAEDRCHRAGTISTVNVYSIITKGTVDEKVYDIIVNKEGIAKYIVDNELSFERNPELFDILLGH